MPPVISTSLAFCDPQGNRAHVRCVVGIHHIHVRTGRPALDRGGGYDDHVVLHVQQQTGSLRIDSGTGHYRRSRKSAFRREVPVVGSIWLSTVSSVPEAILVAILAVVGIHAQTCAGAQLAQHRRQAIGGNGEEDRDGLQLRDAWQARWHRRHG